MGDVVLSSLEDGIRTITLNRPDSVDAINGELLEMGVAWRVVPDDRVLREAREVAVRIMELTERTVSDLKRALAKVSVGELETALLLETEAIMRAALDSDRGLV